MPESCLFGQSKLYCVGISGYRVDSIDWIMQCVQRFESSCILLLAYCDLHVPVVTQISYVAWKDFSFNMMLVVSILSIVIFYLL